MQESHADDIELQFTSFTSSIVHYLLARFQFSPMTSSEVDSFQNYLLLFLIGQRFSCFSKWFYVLMSRLSLRSSSRLSSLSLSLTNFNFQFNQVSIFLLRVGQFIILDCIISYLEQVSVKTENTFTQQKRLNDMVWILG